jgi:hypothetical protein
MEAGREYVGSFRSEEDEWDLYYLVLMRAGSIEAWLTGIPRGNDYNLYLYDDELDLKDYSGEVGPADEQVLVTRLPIGKHYLGVKRLAGSSETESYGLRAAF